MGRVKSIFNFFSVLLCTFIPLSGYAHPGESAETFDFRSKTYLPEYFDEEVTLEASGKLRSLIMFFAIYQNRSTLFGWSSEHDWLKAVSLSP